MGFDPFATAPAAPRPDDPVAQVVVVCHANLARSPLVMVLLEREVADRCGARPEVWVRSAGVMARDGLPAAEDSRDQARRRGLDLAAHRSARLDRGDVADADLVVTMTESQRDAAARLAPGATAWTFTLPELARLTPHVDPSGLDELPPRDRLREAVRRAAAARARVARPDRPEDVADPYGGPAAGYDAMARIVEGLVADVAGVLLGDGGHGSDGPPR